MGKEEFIKSWNGKSNLVNNEKKNGV